MCGISGGVELRGNESPNEIVSRIILDQHMRGPDASNVVNINTQNQQVSLGHNRLSIIDLKERANQPMNSTDGRYSLVFNGEIYNYIELRSELEIHGITFITTSDTEVLLQALIFWGEEAIPKLNGMFAFAFLDKETEELILCRDRFGVKPLFYYCDGERLYFASSTRAMSSLLECKPNLSYVARGLSIGIYEDDTDFCAYEGIAAVPASHLIKISLSDQNLTPVKIKYYDFFTNVQSVADEISSYSYEDLIEKISSILDSSIQLRLRSDVTIGVSISGGLDSTVLAGLALKKQNNLKGYTLGQPDNNESEGPLVKQFSNKSGMDIQYIWPSEQNIVQDYWKTLRDQDAPFLGGSIIAQNLIFQAASKDKVKVLIGGQGGDEAFMGYRKFMLFNFKQLVETKQHMKAAHFFFNQIQMFFAEAKHIGIYKRRLKAYQGKTPELSIKLANDAPVLDISRPKGMSVLERQCLDITKFSLPTLLRYEDRNSMGNSIETRLPFLDYRLLEIGAALPVFLKLQKGYGKYCLREIAKGVVPESIRLARYKKGFPAPDNEWLKNGLADDIYSKLSDNWASIEMYCDTRLRFEQQFSPKGLIGSPENFWQAISLCWLSGIHK